MKKTVLLFNSLYPAQTGGMEVYNYHLSNTLLNGDYPNVIMLTSIQDRVNNTNVFYINSKLFRFRRWGLDMLSIFLYCLFNPNVKMRQWDTLMIPYSSNFDMAAWPIVIFSKLTGFKYSVHCHGGGIKIWKYPRLQKLFFKNASHVAAVSDSIRNEYSKRLGFQVDYLPPLVKFHYSNLSKAEILDKFTLPAYNKVILYVGSIKPLKSPETLLKAFNDIDAALLDDTNTGLVFAGDGPMREELKNKYSGNSRIHFLGNVPNDQVRDLFKLADIYVLCSWFEGTSVSLLEAMYNKCCCIGTDVQGINAMIQNNDNGVLIPKEGSEELLQKLSSLLIDDASIKSFGQRAFEFYNANFSYEKHINEVQTFLNR